MKCNHSIQCYAQSKDKTGYYCVRCNPRDIKAIKYKKVNKKVEMEVIR